MGTREDTSKERLIAGRSWSRGRGRPGAVFGGLALAMLSVLIPLACRSLVGETRRPNVLLICIDDLRPELSFLEATWARTPAIDELAAGGVAFRNHFAAVPTCGASRYALLTGRHPLRSGVTSGNSVFSEGPHALSRDESVGVRTLPERFRRAGWRTVCVGKVSHTPDGRVFAYDGSGDGRDELPGAWDALATPFGPWKRGWGAFFGYADGRHREDGSGYRAVMEFAATKDDALPDGLIAKAAAEQLAQLATGGQPFFLAVGFSKPHLPFVATRDDWQAVKSWNIGPAEHPQGPASAYTSNSGEFFGYRAPFGRVYGRGDVLDARAQVKMRRAYAACVRFVDRQVGRVLAALDEQGLADDTIVVLWSDHGWHLGESAQWGKHTPFERAVRSPLIVRAPGVGEGGRVSDALVEATDVAPTLAALCGLAGAVVPHGGGGAGAGGVGSEPSDTGGSVSARAAEAVPLAAPWDGASLVPLLTGDGEALRDEAVSCWGSAVSVRTVGHRLIARRQGDGSFTDVELYALTDGEDPLRDRADEQPELVAALLARVRERSRRPRRRANGRAPG